MNKKRGRKLIQNRKSRGVRRGEDGKTSQAKKKMLAVVSEKDERCVG